MSWHIKITDEKLKQEILEASRHSGLNIDGDILFYNGERYYVHCKLGIVERILYIDNTIPSEIG